MENIFFSLLKGVAYILIPYGIYCFIRNRWFVKLKLYMGILLLIIILTLCMAALEKDTNIFKIILEVGTALFVIYSAINLYKADKKYKDLYLTFVYANINPVIVIGITMIDKENHEFLKASMKQIKNSFVPLIKKRYAYVAYDNKCLKISLIFLSRRDLNELIKYEFDKNITLTNIEESRKGGSATIEINFP